jgi:hypothetical protein
MSTDEWIQDSHLRWFAEQHRGEVRAEVNKLLAGVLENEPQTLRQLLIFSVLLERADDLRDKVLEQYIQEHDLMIQPHEMDGVAKLAGLSAQSVRHRQTKMRVVHWESVLRDRAKEQGCTCKSEFTVETRPKNRLEGRGVSRIYTLHHQDDCPAKGEEKQ